MMTNCEYAMTDVPARYVTGRLQSADAERFEEHYFGCDWCANELEVGSLLRRRGVRSNTVRLLGVAAAIVALITSAVILLRPGTVENPAQMRGTSLTEIRVTASASAGLLSVRWNRVSDAASYRVTLFDDKGTILQQIPASDVALTTAVPMPGGRMFVRVEAVDRSRRTIGSSSLQPVETSK